MKNAINNRFVAMTRFLIPLLLLISHQVSYSDESNMTEKILGPLDKNTFLVTQAQAIHASALTLDAHADIEIPGKPSNYAGKDGLSKVAPSKMRAGGLNAVVMTLAVGPMPRNNEGYAAAKTLAKKKLAAVKKIIANKDNNAILTLSSDELIAAHEKSKLALILGFQNGLILGTNLNELDTLYKSGVRVFALTHMGHNDFADSSRTLFDSNTGTREPDAEHGGLSAGGKSAILRINALGGIVDISQLSSQAALQAIELSTTPVIASHSNVRALTRVSRNLSDEEIDRIGETGGVIHVAPFRGYLYNSSDPDLDGNIRAVRRESGISEDYLYPFELYWEIDDKALKKDFIIQISSLLGPIGLKEMIDHIDYITKRIGVDHVGIGTDFNHGSGVAGFDDASDALNVTIELLKRGYNEDDIIKIWGGNFIRVWRAVEKTKK